MACNGNDYVSNFRDGTLYLMDGGGNTLTVPLEMGDVAISGLSGDMTEVAVYRSRGRTVAVRKTNDLQPSIAFSAMLNRLSSVTNNVIADFIRFSGKFASNTRTTGICGDAKTLDAKWQVSTPDGTEQIIVRDVVFTYDISEGDPSSISLSGTIYNPDVTITGAT
jgi:hypothetical protein